MSRFLAGFLPLFFTVACWGQDAYPSKPITMVVPFPPGGVAEIVGRPLAAVMEKSLHQPVILINRPGAGGAVGMASVAKALMVHRGSMPRVIQAWATLSSPRRCRCGTRFSKRAIR